MLFRHMDNLVAERARKLLGNDLSTTLASYEHAFTSTLPRIIRHSHESLPEVLARARFEGTPTPIFLFGDFHARAYASAGFWPLLQDLVARVGGERLILALECFDPKAQFLLDQYRLGQTRERHFLQKSKFHRWGFSFDFYRGLFSWAATTGVQICGLDEASQRGPWHRDTSMALEIARLRDRSPDSIIVALVGEHHLASEHLPRQLRKHLGFRCERILWRIFSNLDPYTRASGRFLEKRGLYGVSPHPSCPLPGGLYHLGQQDYCYLNEPYWFRWLSYCLWLESEGNAQILEDEANDVLSELLIKVNSSLGLDCHLDRLSRFKLILETGVSQRLATKRSHFLLAWRPFDWAGLCSKAQKILKLCAQKNQESTSTIAHSLNPYDSLSLPKFKKIKNIVKATAEGSKSL